MDILRSTRSFKSGSSEAVRLPKGVGFGIGTEFRVEREAGRIVLPPISDPAEIKAGTNAFLQCAKWARVRESRGHRRKR